MGINLKISRCNSRLWEVYSFFGVGASAWIIIRVKSLCQDQSGINSIDDIALKHSSVGDFTYNPKTGQISRMKGGGHGQSNINF